MPAPSVNEYKERLKFFEKPIDRQIMLCDDTDDIMMFATVMMSRAKDIFANQIGNENAANLLRSMAKNLENADN